MLQFQSEALKLRSYRQELLSANIANSDTPNYKAVDFEFAESSIRVLAQARVTGQTGVEMEALTAAAVAGLTLIDMTKGLEKGVYLEHVRLLEKSGGRSGTWKR